MGLLNNVAIQWLIRRVPDWGGWIGTILTTLFGIYAVLPAGSQEIVQMALSGNWQQITLGSLVPLLVVIYSQVISFRKTVQPQFVREVAGKTVSTPLSEVPDRVEAEVKVATPTPRRRTLVDVLLGK